MSDDAQATELGRFLRARRRDISPADVGLPETGHRRVQGLRREEIALLASISADYYTRIEQGRRPASEAVLDTLCRVMRMSADEREYAFGLARAAAARTRGVSRPRATRERVPPGIEALIESMENAPAVVQNGRLDVVATNTLGRAFYSVLFDGMPLDGKRRHARPNMARFIFLDPHAADFYVDWETIADDAVAMLRVEAGQSPYDRNLTDLIGELATRSEEFKLRWAGHEIRGHRRGLKRVHHAIVGELVLRFEVLPIPDSGGLMLYGYTAEPGTGTEEALRLLGSWAATEATSVQHSV